MVIMIMKCRYRTFIFDYNYVDINGIDRGLGESFFFFSKLGIFFVFIFLYGFCSYVKSF